MPGRPATSHKRPATPRRRRGGRRSRAGAPRGNLNALKSGRYSQQVKALKLALQALPATTDVLRRFDAAADAKRATLARALHFVAELLIADPALLGAMQGAGLARSPALSAPDAARALKQSLEIAGIGPAQLREHAKNRDNNQTIKGGAL